MSASPGGQALRNAFYENGCQSIPYFTYGTGDAFANTFFKPKYWTSTALQVGGFNASATTNDDGTIDFCIWNRAGTKSFFYHWVGNAPWDQGPMSTVAQVFCWTERIDLSRCNCD